MTQTNFDSDPDEMELLEDSDAFEGPWMATVEVGEEVHFEIDRTRTWVQKVEPPFEIKGKSNTINQVLGEMKNINYAGSGEEVEDDGRHVAPFWAGGPLKKCLKKAKGPSNKKWVKMAYYREAEEEDRIEADGTKRTVTINSANFKLL